MGGRGQCSSTKEMTRRQRAAEENQYPPPQRNERGRGALGRGLRLARSLSRRAERCASLCRCAFRCTAMGKQKGKERVTLRVCEDRKEMSLDRSRMDGGERIQRGREGVWVSRRHGRRSDNTRTKSICRLSLGEIFFFFGGKMKKRQAKCALLLRGLGSDSCTQAHTHTRTHREHIKSAPVWEQRGRR